jgi:predicted aspartyl protease
MPTFRYRYSSADPPAPTVFLRLTHPTTGVSVDDLPGLVDTGADQTVVPRRVADHLSLPQLDQQRVEGFDGTPQFLPTAVLRLAVRDLSPVEMEVIVSDRVRYVVLGRDVLNRYVIALDGPNTVLQISGD